MAVAVCGGAYIVVSLVTHEARTSQWQARYMSRLGKSLTYEILPGPSDSIRYPHSGPYDLRLGYERLGEFGERLLRQGYVTTAQSRMSYDMVRLMDQGIFPPYREKTQAGLVIRDCNALTMSLDRYPQRQYDNFDAIPKVLVSSLLFVENQNLLNPEYPMMNPALDWRRFSRAVMDQGIRLVDRGHGAPGGSTLATQIEKYRHSPEGKTQSIADKLRQMTSASLRAYRDGPDTQRARENIVVDYVNTVPMSARAGHGEIEGLGDAMFVWYGEDFAEVNQLLREMDPRRPSPRAAQAYKRALSLIISQRRPSYHLRRDDTNLDALTGSYLRLLAASNVITAELRDAALEQSLDKAAPPQRPAPEPWVTRKAVNQVRNDVQHMLGVESRYDLDRLDLTVDSTINREAQRLVTQTLQRIRNKDDARQMGLYGKNLLRDGDDPSKLVASLTLFERVGNASVVRVQADNVDQPFDINSGARLNLGSTAKLRTLVTYLEVIDEIAERYRGMSVAELKAIDVPRQDALTRWTVDYLMKAKTPAERSRQAVLEAAMERKYSGNAGEAFFTGGGMQAFTNFEKWEGERQMTVRVAFQHSVNLVFIRMMRDIVRYQVWQEHPDAATLFEDRDSPRRRAYLEQFADEEGSSFMTAFWQRYRGKTNDERLKVLLDRVKLPTPRLAAVRLSVTLLSVRPDTDYDTFARTLRERLPKKFQPSEEDLQALFVKYGHDKFNLNDRGYLSRIHPLELWMMEYLGKHPDATLKEILDASEPDRQTVYAWLFKTRSKLGQDARIRTLLEREAFEKIAMRWHRLGYPFESLTPSYATAVGASGDRPAALAELAGIILGNGVDAQPAAVRTLAFAGQTPYATTYGLRPQPGKPLIAPEIATLVRRSMLDVVQAGTAKSINGAFVPVNRKGQPQGAPLAVGGKTGTGDQRFQTYGPGGRVISSRAVNRSATFVFVIGERYFGTVTVHVREPYAARYVFTSALAVRVLRSLAPQISAMAAPGSNDATLLRCRDTQAAPTMTTLQLPDGSPALDGRAGGAADGNLAFAPNGVVDK
ncbi:transglycosylase domain-containing protein [Cupriavidus sp. SZY C1]|uniref:transglycosylase domain-containing protein n=1 Tax=Cupriavidus sp. SZY C1 TaxID=3055037 RepID=UPI0028BE74F7|nr:transglycosylase domain-containing protein [Cupriavidus sp. SZY C1]